MDSERVTIDRKLLIPGLIVGVVAVMAITVMGVQYMPFMTRQEAAAERDLIMQRVGQDELQEKNDEARIQKLEDHYSDIQQELATLNTNLARYTQQVIDQQAHEQRGR